MNLKRAFFLLGLVILLGIQNSQACTNFLVTRGASTDGSTIISYAADSHVLFGELYFRPSADYAEGTMVDIYDWDTGKYLGKIKQALHTYSVIGNMNEFQVSIGETTYGGRKELHDGPSGIIDYGSLMWLALQRAKSAREAIKVIAGLFEEYGYSSSGESFSIADKNEVWIMELIGKGKGEKGALWVARMIPDGYISAHANQARITTFPFSEKNNWFDKEQTTFHSPDVISFARDKGWYDGKDKDFSFSDTYAAVGFGGARFCEIRVWSFFKSVNKKMDKYFDYAKGNIKHSKNGYASNRMPLWIKPDNKISAHDVMNFMRDHLEGTELDMRKDVGAGPYEMPYRWRPLTWKVDDVGYCNERATATQQTGFSFVSQMRSWLPDPIGGIHWFSVDDAASTVYFPMYCGATDIPMAYKHGNGAMMKFSNKSAFWIFNQVSNFAYLRYNIIHPEIHEYQQSLENKYVKYVSATDKAAVELYNADKKIGIEYITDFSCNTGDKLAEDWKLFYEYLFTRYMDGNVKEPDGNMQNPKVKQPGYSDDFYKKIVKDTGEKLKVIGKDGH